MYQRRNCTQHTGGGQSAMSLLPCLTKLTVKDISSGMSRRRYTYFRQWSHDPLSGGFFSQVRTGTGSLPDSKEQSLMQFLPFQRMPLTLHLSVQLIQGSIDKTMTGTSASSHPCNIFTSGGMFVNVGVLILDRTRNFVPLPLR
jgi:hypothetical protein